MFLSEWREFPSAPCLAGKKKTWRQLVSRCCWNRARPWRASELFFFLVGLRTYQHPVFIHRLTYNWLQSYFQYLSVQLSKIINLTSHRYLFKNYIQYLHQHNEIFSFQIFPLKMTEISNPACPVSLDIVVKAIIKNGLGNTEWST